MHQWKSGRYSSSSAKRLLRDTFRLRWKLIAMSILFVAGVSAFTAGLAASTRLIVNDVFVAANAEAAVQVAIIVVGVSLGKSIFQYANTVTQILLIRSVSIEMQKRVFARMLKNDIPYFVSGHAPDLMAKIRLYGVAAGTAFVTMTNRLLTEAITMLGLFGVMLYQDAWMTLLCMLILPLILGLVSFLSRKIRAVASEEATLSVNIFQSVLKHLLVSKLLKVTVWNKNPSIGLIHRLTVLKTVSFLLLGLVQQLCQLWNFWVA